MSRSLSCHFAVRKQAKSCFMVHRNLLRLARSRQKPSHRSTTATLEPKDDIYFSRCAAHCVKQAPAQSTTPARRSPQLIRTRLHCMVSSRNFTSSQWLQPGITVSPCHGTHGHRQHLFFPNTQACCYFSERPASLDAHRSVLRPVAAAE